jgi:general stress protein YciG
MSEGVKRRGFASMDPARRREIARIGGSASARSGNSHKWTSDEAREHGRNGGIESHRRRRESKDES